MNNLIAQGKISVEMDTGDIKFDKCDAAEIDILTSTGNITGSLLTDKVFIARSNTGRINVPETTTGGKCKLTTNTGNIKIHVE